MRSQYIDFLKGVAIIAVICFHIGFMKYGYLGVDVFFVLGGYLTSKSIIKSIELGSFTYWGFLKKRLLRLWPLSLLFVCISSILGYIWMLPGDYKLLSEQIVGGSLFFNNIVQFITSSNYWDTSNDFKPLMHLWYLGVLFQFYIVFPLFFLISKFRKDKRALYKGVGFVLVISLLFYFVPISTSSVDTAVKFYLFPARLFEFLAGALVAIKYKYSVYVNKRNVIWILTVFVISVLTITYELNINKVKLLFIVLLVTGVLIMNERQPKVFENVKCPIITKLGTASFSIYLFHQVLIAFYRYTVNSTFSLLEFISLFVGSLLLGLVCYSLLEKPLGRFIKKKQNERAVFICCLCFACLLVCFGTEVYFKHGVMRDVPELDVYMEKPETWEPQRYNARITEMFDKDFVENGKKKIFVWGDSYGRDWVNILIEDHLDSDYNISYHQANDRISVQRIKDADYVFIASNLRVETYYNLIPHFMRKRFWHIGHKRYSFCNGKYFNKNKHSKDYYLQTDIEPDVTKEMNRELQLLFGERNIIDLMGIIRNKDGKIRVFTPDKKFISNDGMHLTPSGARYYANRLNVREMLK